jgi:hypothetical protein
MVTLPHAGNFHVEDLLLVAGWKMLWEMHGPHEQDPLSSPMPRLNSTDALATKLKSGQHFSVDVLCRCLGPYPDTMQATAQFIEDNQAVVESRGAENPTTNQRVQGLALSAAIQRRWNTLPRSAQARYENEARALLLSIGTSM